MFRSLSKVKSCLDRRLNVLFAVRPKGSVVVVVQLAAGVLGKVFSRTDSIGQQLDAPGIFVFVCRRIAASFFLSSLRLVEIRSARQSLSLRSPRHKCPRCCGVSRPISPRGKVRTDERDGRFCRDGAQCRKPRDCKGLGRLRIDSDRFLPICRPTKRRIHSHSLPHVPVPRYNRRTVPLSALASGGLHHRAARSFVLRLSQVVQRRQCLLAIGKAARVFAPTISRHGEESAAW